MDTTEIKKNYVVYAELTPNPNSVKFVANRMLLADGTVEYKSRADAGICPLALQLFEFTGVKSVFITSNFVTITKASDIDWFDITNILREFIKGFLDSGERIFTSNPLTEEPSAKPKNNFSAQASNETPPQPLSNSITSPDVALTPDETLAIEEKMGRIRSKI
jgi:hypothetical protein